MQCPRCGLQNAPDVTACARCGLPAPRVQPHGQQPPAPQAPPGGQPPAGPPQTPPRHDQSETGDTDQTTVIRRTGGAHPGGTDQPAPPPQDYQPRDYQPAQDYPPQQGYPPQPGQQYGQVAPSGRPTYQSGNVTPSAAWPMTTGDEKMRGQSDPLGVAALVFVVMAAVLGLGYAAWAFTARRGIFADFADGNSVSADDAQSNDSIDMIFLIAAGLVALVALVLWVMRKVSGKTRGDVLELGGLVVSGLATAGVLAGLYLSNAATDADGQVEQGEKAVTATLVTGGGFLLLSVGLILGVLALRGAPPARDQRATAGAYPSW